MIEIPVVDEKPKYFKTVVIALLAIGLIIAFGYIIYTNYTDDTTDKLNEATALGQIQGRDIILAEVIKNGQVVFNIGNENETVQIVLIDINNKNTVDILRTNLCGD